MENELDEPVSYNTLGFTYVSQGDIQLDNSWNGVLNVLPEKICIDRQFLIRRLYAGSKFTHILAIEIPENNPIMKIPWDYFDIKFTVELPE